MKECNLVLIALAVLVTVKLDMKIYLYNDLIL